MNDAWPCLQTVYYFFGPITSTFNAMRFDEILSHACAKKYKNKNKNKNNNYKRLTGFELYTFIVVLK